MTEKNVKAVVLIIIGIICAVGLAVVLQRCRQDPCVNASGPVSDMACGRPNT